jgi:phosphonate transport system permease protein
VPDVPEEISIALVLRFMGAWAITGIAIAFVLWERGIRPSSAINTVLAWLGAAALVLPAAATFNVLVPLEHLSRGDEPVYGAGFFVFASFTMGLIGGAAALGNATKLPMITLGVSVLFFTGFAGAQVGFSIAALLRDFGKVTEVPNFWPPDFEWMIGETGTWWPGTWEFGSATRANPLTETFRIAIIASVFGCGLALPLAFLASRLTAPSTTAYTIAKSFMNLIRTMPDLFWAMLFVTSVGVGPFAGALALVFFSLAIMSKLLSETVDGADPGPLEAAKATGASHFPAVRSSVLPQVLPNYVAYALYIFEINIRASVVIGLAGAGGIGRVLEAQRSFFRFDRVLAIVVVIFVIVFIIEQISVAMRRRLV